MPESLSENIHPMFDHQERPGALEETPPSTRALNVSGVLEVYIPPHIGKETDISVEARGSSGGNSDSNGQGLGGSLPLGHE